MESPQWQRIRELFDAAADLDVAERDAYLSEECGVDGELRRRVEELLAADVATVDVAIERSITPADVGTDLTEVITGKEIGGYRIQRILGTGGMSAVFLAEQENPRREVAVKTMLLGMLGRDARRRFEYESEVLGRLHHPAIAQIYEAGTWNEPLVGKEVPFFAMEYVEGAKPFDVYVREAELELPEALELFLEVCEAVHYGHQYGVIHRDLKPANVLVDGQGRPKIIDFGIARATDADVEGLTLQTRTGHVLGTLRYMPPEQLDSARDQVDLRVDVYALGVMLYELLAGVPPFDPTDKSITGFALDVRETEPERPSRCVGGFPLTGLDRDLDWITRKAIAANKGERYQSVSELVADLRRHLAHEPVSVGPPSTSYRVRKFVRRNIALVGGLAGVFSVLAVGMATTTFWWLRADEQRLAAERLQGIAKEQEAIAEEKARIATEQTRIAEASTAAAKRQARKAETVNAFFNELLKFADPAEGRYASRPDWTIREALDTVSEVWFQQLADDPDVESHVRLSMGNAYTSLEDLQKAETHIARAVELRRETLDAKDPDLADALVALASIRRRQKNGAAARELSREALSIFVDSYGENHGKVALCHLNIGTSYDDLADLDAREKALQKALDIYRRLPGNHDRFIASCLPHLGVVAYYREDYDRAISLYEEGLAMFRKAGQSGHPNAAATHDVLAQILETEKGDSSGAIEHLTRALEINKAAFGVESKPAGRILIKLANVCSRSRDYAAALKYLRAAEVILSKTNVDWQAVQTRRSLAILCRDQGLAEDAVEFAQRSFDAALQLTERRSKRMNPVAVELGRALRGVSRFVAATEIFEVQVDVMAKVGGALDVLAAKNELAITFAEAGRLPEAEKLFATILDAAVAVEPENKNRALHQVMFRRAYGVYLRRAGRLQESETALLSALEQFERIFDGDNLRVRQTLRDLIDLYAEWKKPDERRRCETRLGTGR